MTALRRSVILFSLLALIGCGGSDGGDNATTSSQASSTQSSDEKGPTLKKVTHENAMAVVKRSDAQVTVVNFWATWCVPCVEEFPAFVKLDRALDDRGVDVMFISTDFPNEQDKVVEFLAEQGVTGTSYLKTGKSTEFVNAFSGDWSGAVPATFVYGSEGTLLDFWEGKASYDELKERVSSHLDSA